LEIGGVRTHVLLTASCKEKLLRNGKNNKIEKQDFITEGETAAVHPYIISKPDGAPNDCSGNESCSVTLDVTVWS